VLALPAPYVGLVGPLHGWLLTSRRVLNTKTAAPWPRKASIDERPETGRGGRRRPPPISPASSPQARCGNRWRGKDEQRGCFSGRESPLRDLLSTPVESDVEPLDSPANRLVFEKTGQAGKAIVGPAARCYARPSLSSRRSGPPGWINRLS
jgi:hypothetical protein